jgi:hypothetical protein
MNGDYAAARQSNGQQSQSMVANSQLGGQQGPSIGSNSTSVLR